MAWRLGSGSTVTGYFYAFDYPAPYVFVAAGKDGTATLAITPDNLAELTLYVSAFDGSARSPAASFAIQVLTAPGNVATLAWWKLSGGHGTAAADATGNGNTAKLTGDATPNCAKTAAPDGYKCSVLFGGHGGQALVSPSLLPVVANNGSFSVAAWVNVTKCAFSCVALSEDASNAFQFALKYQRVCRAGGKSGACWKFSLPHEDLVGAAGYNAVSPPGSAKLGTWTQLIGTFYAAHGTLQLYVNGVALGQVQFISPWGSSPAEPVRIGNLAPGAPSTTGPGGSPTCACSTAWSRPRTSRCCSKATPPTRTTAAPPSTRNIPRPDASIRPLVVRTCGRACGVAAALFPRSWSDR